VKPGAVLDYDAATQKSATTGTLRGYQPELDAVRLLAFLLVFFLHGLPASDINSAATGTLSQHWPPWHFIYVLTASFASGMCLFFALSAYLITGLLLAERSTTGAISIRKFYIRRILRIWPLHLLGISIGIAFALLRHDHAGAMGFVWFVLLAGNIYCGMYGWILNPMTPLWSISLEEQFYLIWPFTMRFLSRVKMALAAVVMIAASNIQLWYFGEHHARIGTTIWTSTLVQFEMFAVGILLAVVRRPEPKRYPLAGLCLILMAPFLWFSACVPFGALNAGVLYARSGPTLMAGYAAIALGCVAVIWGATLIGPKSIPARVSALGKISYGLYVYHILVITSLQFLFKRAHLPHSPLLVPVLSLPIVILLAWLSYRYFESPFLRLKRHFEVVESRPV
jgi:peptidoglycan/LPS O-acetylase OafA/YrhL